MTLPRYQWSKLNRQQVGAYTEYFVKMELTMYGFQVYESEVDDHGVDFVARYKSGPFLEVQVKSLRSTGYVFMEKTKFELHPHRYLAFGLLVDGHEPDLFLMPSTRWHTPDTLFADHEYEDRKSLPEFGLNVSRKNLPALAPYAFAAMVERLLAEANRPTA